jgi:2-(3-amino-3-carboxypropyl)histidine synthase
MEKDRAIADLGPDVSAELNGELETEVKAPQRRFIGRRAADAKAAARAEADGSNGTIEDSGAMQGAGQPYSTTYPHRLLMPFQLRLAGGQHAP